jgi:transcription elongation factor GreA
MWRRVLNARGGKIVARNAIEIEQADCPECYTVIHFHQLPGLGRPITCHVCDTRLEVIRTNPLRLGWFLEDEIDYNNLNDEDLAFFDDNGNDEMDENHAEMLSGLNDDWIDDVGGKRDMPHKTMYMTERGFAKLVAELARLRNEERPALTDCLHDALAGGDSMDNSELLLLRDELAFINGRIYELDDILRHAELIKRGEPDGRVHLGNTVVIQMNGDVPETYTIVGSAEADPDDGLISNESPMGKALLDHAVGDDVTVTAPDGEMCFRIIAVT